MSKKKAKRPWLRLVGQLKPRIDEAGFIQNVELPSDEKVIVKEVPAKVDGTVVGTAYIFEDETVEVVIDEDAPQWAKDKIESVKNSFGYSIGED
jgi:hypothetical protein